MTARITLAALLLVTALAPACGGDDDIDCSYDSSCGGDPTGQWDVAGSCTAPEQQTLEECPGATLTQTESTGGTWTFDDDMTYQAELETVDILTIRAPLTCLQQERPEATTCEQLNGDGISCTTQMDVCDCRGVSTSSSEISGMWSVTGSTLSLLDELGTTTATYDFCREDDATLKLVPLGDAAVLVLEQ